MWRARLHCWLAIKTCERGWVRKRARAWSTAVGPELFGSFGKRRICKFESVLHSFPPINGPWASLTTAFPALDHARAPDPFPRGCRGLGAGVIQTRTRTKRE